MISQIIELDYRMIGFFQWTIRQIELYTPVTRKEVILSVLMIYESLLIIFGFVVMVGIFFHTSSMYLFFLSLGLSFYQCFCWKNLFSREKENNECLPVEIITRKKARCLFLVGAIPMAITILPITFLILFFSEDFLIKIFFTGMIFLFAIAFMDFLCEYLVCTISLPPGEKEKKKIEREVKQMQLQPIKIR